jgi:hypothetical protein
MIVQLSSDELQYSQSITIQFVSIAQHASHRRYLHNARISLSLAATAILRYDSAVQRNRTITVFTYRE